MTNYPWQIEEIESSGATAIDYLNYFAGSEYEKEAAVPKSVKAMILGGALAGSGVAATHPGVQEAAGNALTGVQRAAAARILKTKGGKQEYTSRVAPLIRSIGPATAAARNKGIHDAWTTSAGVKDIAETAGKKLKKAKDKATSITEKAVEKARKASGRAIDVGKDVAKTTGQFWTPGGQGYETASELAGRILPKK